MGHTNLPLERQVGSRPSDYGCRNCDGSTYYSDLAETERIKQEKIDDTKKIQEEKIQQEKRELLNIQLEKEIIKQEELIQKQLDILENQSNELDSFYEFDGTLKEIDNDIQSIDSNEGVESIESIEGVESIESIESIEGMNGMSKQIPLEKITPVMLLLGAGIVFYLFGSGRFDKK